MCLSYCLLAVGTQFGCVWCRLSISFPLVVDPSWLCGDKRSLYPDNVPDIAQKDGLGGPRPESSQFYC